MCHTQASLNLFSHQDTLVDHIFHCGRPLLFISASPPQHLKMSYDSGHLIGTHLDVGRIANPAEGNINLPVGEELICHVDPGRVESLSLRLSRI